MQRSGAMTASQTLCLIETTKGLRLQPNFAEVAFYSREV
jgi:hypothetical protein